MSAPAIVPGDVVRTGTGNVRKVTAVRPASPSSSLAVPHGAGTGSTTYALMPLAGGVGRRSYAERVTLVRTAELERFYELERDAWRWREQGAVEHARRRYALARLALARATRRGADSPGELKAARDALAGLTRSLDLEV